MNGGKRLKQSHIGRFFQKEKEPALWTSIDENSTEQKKSAFSPANKVTSGKPIHKLKGAATGNHKTHNAASGRFNEEVIPRTPKTGPKRKSLVSQKSKSRLSVPAKGGKIKKCLDENRDVLVIADEDQSVDKENQTGIRQDSQKKEESEEFGDEEHRKAQIPASITDVCISNKKNSNDTSILCVSGTDVFEKTPDAGPKRKSLVGQMSKSRLSLHGNNTTNKVVTGKKNVTRIRIDSKQDAENAEEHGSFSFGLKQGDSSGLELSIKKYSLKGARHGAVSHPSNGEALAKTRNTESKKNNLFKQKSKSRLSLACNDSKTSKYFAADKKPTCTDLNLQVADSKPGSTDINCKEKHKKQAIVLSNEDVSMKDTDDNQQFSDCEFKSHVNPLFTKLQTKGSTIEPFVGNSTREGDRGLSPKQSNGFEEGILRENANSCGAAKRVQESLDTAYCDCQGSEPKKTMKLKLKRLDKKRVFKSGPSGVSPLKKKQAKEIDMEDNTAMETQCSTQDGRKKQFGRRNLFIRETSNGKRRIGSSEMEDVAIEIGKCIERNDSSPTGDNFSTSSIAKHTGNKFHQVTSKNEFDIENKEHLTSSSADLQDSDGNYIMAHYLEKNIEEFKPKISSSGAIRDFNIDHKKISSNQKSGIRDKKQGFTSIVCDPSDYDSDSVMGQYLQINKKGVETETCGTSTLNGNDSHSTSIVSDPGDYDSDCIMGQYLQKNKKEVETETCGTSSLNGNDSHSTSIVSDPGDYDSDCIMGQYLQKNKKEVETETCGTSSLNGNHSHSTFIVSDPGDYDSDYIMGQYLQKNKKEVETETCGTSSLNGNDSHSTSIVSDPGDYDSDCIIGQYLQKNKKGVGRETCGTPALIRKSHNNSHRVTSNEESKMRVRGKCFNSNVLDYDNDSDNDEVIQQYSDEKKKGAKLDSCSTSKLVCDGFAACMKGRVETNKDAKEDIENKENFADPDLSNLSFLDLNDSFQISNSDSFIEEKHAPGKHTLPKSTLEAKNGINQLNISKDIDLLNASLLDISFGEDFDAPPPVKSTDFTVKPVLVLEVTRQEYQDGPNRTQPEKMVRLFDEETSSETVCYLRQDWESMEIFPGDFVHITGSKTSLDSTVTLDNHSLRFLTLFPNTLVSGTTISMGITCQRRGVLSELFKTDGPNQVMFTGTFMHELFDVVIDKKVFDVSKLERKAVELLAKHENLNTLYSLGWEEKEFMEKVREFIPYLSKWARKFLKDSPQPSDDSVDFKLGCEQRSDNITRLAISEIVDIEENILCPSLGLKGKVDASVNVTIQRQPKIKKKDAKVPNEVFHVPFELKTGKLFSKLGSIEHRAQVILYSLMMSEKYGKEVDAGLLYYMKASHLQGVPATLKEKRALVIKRNEIVRFLSLENLQNKKLMPGLLKDAHSCKRCPAVNNCMVYHKAVEQGSKETSGISEQFEELTDHMTGADFEYFYKWYHLIMLEAQAEASSSSQNKIWTKTSNELYSAGKCLNEMLLKCEVTQGDQSSLYTFERRKSDGYKKAAKHTIIVNDRVVISEENCKTFGLTTGLVKSVAANKISVFCKEKIKARSDIRTTLFRIEKDESLTSHKTPLGNLMKLFSSRTDVDKKTRNLVVNLSAPRFSLFDIESLMTQGHNGREKDIALLNNGDNQTSLITQSQVKMVRSVFSSLNPDQKQAVEKCLSAQDYVMILGMPGTGKTTTIACIVKILAALGKTVLITSYTHTAVDNILLKLKQMKVDFLRVGQAHKLHHDIREFAIEEATKQIKTVEGITRFYDNKKIVATTCLGVNHPLFLKKRFDYCIVDEASQITQPVCIGAIRCADVFVLVGDHYQLPPLVQSLEAKNGGMDESLFKRLSEHHPSAVVSLQYQYRMNKDIMALANVVIYDQRMRCGTTAVANELLEMPKLETINQLMQQDQRQAQFIQNVIEPNQPVVFADTDPVPFLESQIDNRISNQKEADLIASIFHALAKGGVEYGDIGIISPYRHQLKVIRDALEKKCSGSDLDDVEINTVDKYQGRDKACIMVSFVRSNSARNIGTLLKDWRRINVAITRAKHKLILIGSRKTLSVSPILKDLVDFTEQNNWLIETPANILQ